MIVTYLCRLKCEAREKSTERYADCCHHKDLEWNPEVGCRLLRAGARSPSTWTLWLPSKLLFYSNIMADLEEKKWHDHLTPTETRQEGEMVERRLSASGRRISVTDAVFGDIQEGGPNVSQRA